MKNNSQSELEFLQEFVQLQEGLLCILESVYTLQGKTFLEWPTSGKVDYQQEQWSFEKHGLGFRFRSEVHGVVVEAHTGFPEHKRLIDAYRLSVYLKSTRIRPSKRPVHGIDDFSETAMGLWLELLETRGMVMQSNLENNRGYLIQTPSG